MIEYNPKRQLHYIPGGAIRAEMGMWPSEEITGWWTPATGSATCVGAYQAKGAASLAASYVNLANPGTNDAAPGTAPGWGSSTGWTFNGTSQYLTTGINPSGTNKTYSMIVRYSNLNLTASNQALIGMFNGGSDSLLIFSTNNNRIVAYSSGSYDTGTGNFNNTSGVLAIAGDTAYYNGTSLGTISAGSNLASIAITIASTGASRYFVGNIQAVAIYSTALTAAQVDTVSDAMAAL